MERITMRLVGNILLEGRMFDYELYVDGTPRTESLLLVETVGDQYVLQVGDQVYTSLNHDFDYRGLVDTLAEVLGNGAVIDYCSWEFKDIVNDWLEVGCDSAFDIKGEVDNYFESLKRQQFLEGC